MKISIHIEDATPEELQRLIGVTLLPPTVAEKRPPVHGAPTNFCKGPWSDAEKAAVLSVPEEEAWQNYHRLFPNSPRTKNAVWRRRGELLLESGNVETPAPAKVPDPSFEEILREKESADAAAGGLPVEAPPAPKEKEEVPAVKKKTHRVSKPYRADLKIPFDYKTQKTEYQRAHYLTKKHGCSYPEALKKEELSCIKQSVKAMPSIDEQKAPVKKDEPVPVTMDTLSPNTIATGMHVRQIKPDQGRQIFGNAVVLTRRNGGLIEVRNGGGKKHVIDARCLEIVPAGEASARATGAAS